jgi:hypothetical protein
MRYFENFQVGDTFVLGNLKVTESAPGSPGSSESGDSGHRLLKILYSARAAPSHLLIFRPL